MCCSTGLGSLQYISYCPAVLISCTMHFLQARLHIFFAAAICLCLSASKSTHGNSSTRNYATESAALRTVTVDLSGKGDFTRVQKAIDSVPPNNKQWIRIYVRPGVYNEKVTIPRDKQFVFLEGASSRQTVIQWSAAGNAIGSSTFTLLADNFVAKSIGFKNSYNEELFWGIDGGRREMTWAPAAVIEGDKASFYECAFISLQDTLADVAGRHYFHSCLIQGAVDFIWGTGKSVYQGCVLKVVSRGQTPGFITAQGRNSAADDGGFVFKSCAVEGRGPAYLGRAYGRYSRVVFLDSLLPETIVPEGWSAWHYVGMEREITYAEVGCSGPGARMTRRVKWLKRLNNQEFISLTNTTTFINRDGWIQNQPRH